MKFYCFVTHFTSVSCSSETTKRGGEYTFSETNSQINVSRLYLWGNLRYSTPKITTSQHMRRNKYSLKIDVFFYLKAENAENLSIYARL